jgi:hypothetical protein
MDSAGLPLDRSLHFEALLHSDVERGALDMGMVLPANFDSQLQAEDATQMDLLIWGESLLKHRTILAVSLVRQIIDVAGREIPVNTQLVLLGEEANIPWDVRLFPFVVIHHHHAGWHDGPGNFTGGREAASHLPRPADHSRFAGRHPDRQRVDRRHPGAV